jgi:hypothetical protein
MREDASRLCRSFVGRRRQGPWRARTDPMAGRVRALREEVDYWEDWLSPKGADDYANRFDPKRRYPIPPCVGWLGAADGSHIRNADVVYSNNPGATRQRGD